MSRVTDEVSVITLAEELIAVGEKGAIEELAQRYPDRHEELRSFLEKHAVLDAFYRDHADLLLDVPMSIGAYNLVQEIGRGGMGVVYSATHPSLEGDLAVKILAVERFRQQSALRRFNIEARACTLMDHPNIVPVFDYGLTEECAYFAMKRIHGRSLADVLTEVNDNQDTIDPSEIGSIGLQAAEAIKYAHGKGVIHRDIKPGNILLDDDGKLWLTDFGLAKLVDKDVRSELASAALTQTGELVGTLRYMAPERFRGVCTEASDIYSLGLTLYELAAGKRVSTSWKDHESSQQCGLPDLKEINPRIPDGLSKIIMKACHFAPGERYQSVAEMHFVLERFCAGANRADRRWTRNSNRKRWWRKDLLALGAGITLATGAIGMLWLKKENERQRNATIEEVAGALDRKLNVGALIHDFSNGSRQDREDLAQILKPRLLSQSWMSPEKRARVERDFDVIMKDFVENGVPILDKIDARREMLTAIPRINGELSRSNLPQQVKDLTGLRLIILQWHATSNRVKPELFQRYSAAYTKLLAGRKLSDSDCVLTDESLAAFCGDMEAIDHFFDGLKPISSLLPK